MKYKDIKLYSAIKSYIEDYLPKLKMSSDHTILSYSKAIELFLDYLNGEKNITYSKITLSDFSVEKIVDYLDYLSNIKGNDARTVNLRLAGIKSFAHYLCRSELLSHQDLALILEIKNRVSISNVVSELSIEQVKYLLSLPNIETKYGLRDLAYMTILYDTGCRDREILNLKLCNVLLQGEIKKINVIGKRNKFRSIPVSNEAAQILEKYIKTFNINNTDFLFHTTRNNIKYQMSDDNALRILKKYEDKAKQLGNELPHLHPHLLRHSRAMHLYHAGMPLPLVSEWLGHASLETSLIYAHASFEMKQEAINKFSSGVLNGKDTDIEIDEEEILKKFAGLK